MVIASRALTDRQKRSGCLHAIENLLSHVDCRTRKHNAFGKDQVVARAFTDLVDQLEDFYLYFAKRFVIPNVEILAELILCPGELALIIT